MDRQKETYRHTGERSLTSTIVLIKTCVSVCVCVCVEWRKDRMTDSFEVLLERDQLPIFIFSTIQKAESQSSFNINICPRENKKEW